ncbi:hypothetical protein L218DRAFT_622310 [Marasmius fiardii PR-910]|nr:hypothetical protein L218DRAFT_622310 [Marasmius fiardii PR-910]
MNTSNNQRPSLRPGTYKIMNVKGGTVIDISGADGTSVIAFTDRDHDDSNQQVKTKFHRSFQETLTSWKTVFKWTFDRFGAGYSIRSVRNGAYLSVNRRDPIGKPIESGFYPVSWELQAYDLQNNIYQIAWPGSGLVFDLRNDGNPAPSNRIDMQDQRYPIFSYTCQLWRLLERSTKDVPAERDDSTSTETTAVPTPDPATGQTIANTVIDAEGLRVGGNGEIAITTTTTTTITTVTQVKRLNVGSV